MSRRGTALREQILYAAKEVFMEVGFERASMDLIAARAKTSKRTLYAHFENKQNLYLAVVDLVRSVWLGKLKTPADYSSNPEDALVMFCSRALEGLLLVWTIRMCRLSIAEAERFPEGAAQYYAVVFTAPEQRLSAYLQLSFGLSEVAGEQAAQRLVGQVLHPVFLRTLFGISPPYDFLDETTLRSDFDQEPVRKAVRELLKTLL